MTGSRKIMCLLINMAGADHRLESARAQLDQDGMDWERLDAVTPESDDFVPVEAPSKWYPELTKAEVACYLSHRKAWRKALDRGADYLVVLEDDLITEGPLSRIVDEVIDADLSWDMIKLFETRKCRSVIRALDCGIRIVDTPTMPIATTGYVVRVSSLTDLLESTRDFRRPIDVELKSYWDLNLRIYSVYPPPIRISEDNVSTIGERKSQLTAQQRLGKTAYTLFSSARARLGYIYRRFVKP